MYRLFTLSVGQAFYQYETSFLVRIGSLFFSFAFGIAQIVPLVLLALPLLAAAEAIYSSE